ncbi:MAG: acetyl-CoA carboxylase biotin carboxylase subunit [Candidatus Paracaedibacteraceae bacterium]|nr:acetyl-CoA carboxylase biotin carboxylase subunit [Candidatus Paracaedibacteraceae bacterium]
MKKILIANRGEIACRIIKTARAMGIKTVAVYSDVDKLLPHVDLADEAYCLGAAPSRESYLNGSKIIDIAKACQADAIHPGYGFLSEKAEFAQAVLDANLIFIGPSSQVIHQMGDKLEAKALAHTAGVNLVPGSTTAITTIKQARDFAQHAGYPILLKAAAGGGGKGMRVVHNDLGLAEGLERAKSEALSAFGDDRVFIEKYIEIPRHIEIQILADSHGNVIHLGERDCSLQRRHQKVVEETPSPFISAAIRQEMAEQAVTLAKKVGYTSAGTVEFIVSPKEEFYFLEMNTRLQVEHPVTEAVNTIDLVEWMIRIARGETLTQRQEEITTQGHAIEVRLYAEDATESFLPSAGRITEFYLPPSEDIRIDTGFTEGDQISIYYDPMIAKVIAHAPTRPQALENLTRFLSRSVIRGVTTNQDFLTRLLSDPAVITGHYHTHYIEENLKRLTQPDNLDTVFIQAALAYKETTTNHTVILDKIPHENQRRIVEINWYHRPAVFEITLDGTIYICRVTKQAQDMSITIKGMTRHVKVIDSHHWLHAQHLDFDKETEDHNMIKAPMPGTVIALPISSGQHVKRGDPLVIIEAMKMENVLKSPKEGTISEILVKNGDTLTRDQLIVKLA